MTDKLPRIFISRILVVGLGILVGVILSYLFAEPSNRGLNSSVVQCGTPILGIGIVLVGIGARKMSTQSSWRRLSSLILLVGVAVLSWAIFALLSAIANYD